MSLLLQGQNIIEMMVILIKKVWQSNGWMNEKWGVWVRKLLEGRECVQRTGIISETFFYSWCSFAQLSVTPPLVSSVSNSIAGWDNCLLINHAQTIVNVALELIQITLLRYSYVLVTITTLWSVARQPNLTKNVEQYTCTFTWYMVARSMSDDVAYC